MKNHSAFLLSSAGLLALGGCGGGGGNGGIVSTPAPVAPPAAVAPPVLTPNPANFDTAEYRRSNAVVSSQAIAAYRAGASGAGVTVAVIDTGVAIANSEFAGRISPASRDLAGDRGYGDEDGHGTEVSAIILAARDGANIHGLAWGATLLALRADTPGSCTTAEGCNFASATLATGFDVAASARARVVNLSLGGGSALQSVSFAAARASAAGAVIVLSAGNEASAEIDPFAASVQRAAPGAVIVAGAIDENRAIADFSNRAGAAASYYLTALGTRVRSFDQTGTAYVYTGTSEAAPIVSGAVALLAQAYPQLSPAQIVEILLSTADDLGAPGTDPVYGRGALNLARAFAPIGTLSVGRVAVPLSADAGLLGSPLGDAGQVGMALRQVAAHDSYGRGYSVDLAANLRQQAPGRLANALLGSDLRTGAGVYGNAEVAVMTRAVDGAAWRGDVATGVEWRDRPRGSFLGGQTRVQLAPGRTLVLGYGQSAGAMLDDATGTAGLVAPLVAWRASETGLVAQPLAGGAAAQRLGDWTLAMAFGAMAMRGVSGGGGDAPATASRAILRADHALGAGQFGLAMEILAEQGALLGSQLPAAYGVRGATTTSAVATLSLPLADWAVRAEARLGLTRADLTGQGLWQGGGRLVGTAGSLTLSRAGVLDRRDTASLTIAQPLRASGTALLATGADPVALRLGPSGREIAVEAGYGRGFDGGGFSLGSFWRHQPGNIAGAAADFGGAARVHLRF
ncbi:S8 family peptidase [Polymorphobacter fuscus]|uniref:S8 family serine peptidase n=1 Tax=Sandarakinorhabdus fusca TaxID=1439888 RepID=A0A7C9GMX5_9SPHN|nr:S8 family peptidase [Polymorphobacter fuscus]KAB7648765.1 S8 family serine peptidase [Polymorphobacter fuscus]MQT16337.1 S8 family serine peptidase [Polymorphobacter fuscus]NJC07375.1 hypothetical protein [Polymorphobacter fuscus]